MYWDGFDYHEGEISISVKVNSVQETCTKCFAIHTLEYEILQATWKDEAKQHQNARSIGEKLKTKSMMFVVSLFSWDLQDFKL